MTIYYDAGTILKSVGALTEQDAVLPVGTDLDVRLAYINDALGEWADAYTWQDLRVSYPMVTPNDSTASIGLPTNFRQPLTSVWEFTDVNTKIEHKIILPEDRFNLDPTDKAVYLSGTILNKSIQFPNALGSGVSLVIDYMSFPSSVATLTDFVPVASSQYLVKRVASMVFQARGDSRFPQLYAESQRLLSNAIEEQNVPFGRVNRIPMNTFGFTMGVDG
jgi:hypothetical protein